MALTQEDPRHTAAFGAAWLVAYASAVSCAELEILALLESHGPNGPIGSRRLSENDSCQVVPAWTALQTLATGSGAQLVPLYGLHDALYGIAWTRNGTDATVMMANTYDRQVRCDLKNFDLRVNCAPVTLEAYQVIT